MNVKAASASRASPDANPVRHTTTAQLKLPICRAVHTSTRSRVGSTRSASHSGRRRCPDPDNWREPRALTTHDGRSVSEQYQLLRLFPRNRWYVAVRGWRIRSAAEWVPSWSPQRQRLSSNTPHQRTQGKVFDEKLLIDAVDAQPTPPLNCPKDEEPEVYSLTLKIQDSFEMLSNSWWKPSTESLPSISNTSVHTILLQHVTCHTPNIIIHPSTYQSTQSIQTTRGWKPASYPCTATLWSLMNEFVNVVAC